MTEHQKERREGTKAIRATCPDCGESKAVKRDGRLFAHHRWNGAGYAPELCPGSNRLPATPQDPDEEPEWPVICIAQSSQGWRSKPLDPADPLDARVIAKYRADDPVHKIETYYPEGHPGLLSVEEARLAKEALAFAVESSEFKTKVADEELLDKLADYAKGQKA